MMRLNWTAPRNPARVVVLGARGFLGQALVSRLAASGIRFLPLGSDTLDLAADGAAQKLSGHLQADDALVMLSAITPDKGRDIDASLRNLAMGRNVCAALAERPCAHVVYISSDAVYPFAAGLVSEQSLAAPADLYGAMHRTRELMFEGAVKAPLAVLRPTLIYGADDTHNSYGPNRFRRQAAKDGKITLGGAGEETRDYVYIEDAARLIATVLRNRASGLLNLVSGRSASAAEVARLVAAHFAKPIEIETTPRTAPPTHRAFDITSCRKAFPAFAFTPLEAGLAKAHEASR
ncbi:MAG: NAD-dependent epimerase/dehydratase family protein [Alphaproteobacteria bacterium]